MGNYEPALLSYSYGAVQKFLNREPALFRPFYIASKMFIQKKNRESSSTDKSQKTQRIHQESPKLREL